MATVKTAIEISMAHKLELPYKSPCQRFHGHNYLVVVEVRGELNDEGMVIDFTDVKKTVKELLDHKMLLMDTGANRNIFGAIGTEIEKELGIVFVSFNPTAENLQEFLQKELNSRFCENKIFSFDVTIRETENNWVLK
jgi:6-pyruvoyltetrahydropterin/6-carboxytetrahydropterin synthase